MNFTLFAVPKFIFGLAQTLDIGGTFAEYDTSASPQEADWKAISSDWNAVGQDMRFAMGQVERSTRRRPSDE